MRAPFGPIDSAARVQDPRREKERLGLAESVLPVVSMEQPMPTGQNKLSNCIDFRHWDARALTAVRNGNAWRIRSDFSVVSSDAIEYQAWDGTDWRARWDGD